MSFDPITILVVLSLIASIVGAVIAIWNFSHVRAAKLEQLRIRRRVLELRDRLQLLQRVRQEFDSVDRWLDARRNDRAKAKRLSQIPRPVRVLFEDLNSLLDSLEASPNVEIEEDREVREVFYRALIRSGALALELDNYSTAIRRLRRALIDDGRFLVEIGENVALAYFILGTAYMMWGAQEHSEDELRTAIQFLERALEKSTDKATTNLVMLNLAWATDELARATRDEGLYLRAADYLERILATDPENATARYNLACILSILGRLEEAVHHLALIPHDRDVWELALTDLDLNALRNNPTYSDAFQDILRQKTRDKPVLSDAVS